MKNKFALMIAYLFLSLAAPAVVSASTAGNNVVSVKFVNLNPVVTVTICSPGTNNCTQIPNVLLDSGSDGLRVFSRLMPEGLERIKNASGSIIASCSTLAGGKSAWGQFVIADVALGKDRALNVPVQAIDASLEGVPQGCKNLMTDSTSFTGLNGILGIGMGLRLDKALLPQGNGFFSCANGKCKSCSDYMSWNSCGEGYPTSPSDPNPITFMEKDNNGWILTLPQPRQEGSAELIGTLILGLGTESNNQFPPNLKVFPIDKTGFTPAKFNGQMYNSVLDTGTAVWALPTTLPEVPHCIGTGALREFYCPQSPIDLDFSLFDRTSPDTPTKISFQIISVNQLKSAGAANDLGLTLNSDSFAEGVFLIGVPVYMGRTVYYGITDKKTPLGYGPFYAF